LGCHRHFKPRVLAEAISKFANSPPSCYFALLKKNAPHIRLLGELLFPKQAPWQQRAAVMKLLWAMAIGAITGGFIVAFMLLENKRF